MKKNETAPDKNDTAAGKAEKALDQRRADGAKFMPHKDADGDGAREKPDQDDVPQGGEDEGVFKKRSE
jgi:hypothetical protein